MSSYMVFKVTTVVRNWVFCLSPIHYCGFLPSFYVSLPCDVYHAIILLIATGKEAKLDIPVDSPAVLRRIYWRTFWYRCYS